MTIFSKTLHGRYWVRIACLAVLIFGAIRLRSQLTTGTITITSIPAWGSDGQVVGAVYGTPSSDITLYLFAFVPDTGWVSIPGCGPTPIQSSGQFTANAAPNLLIRNATRFSAFLVPASLGNVPCLGGAPTIPFLITHNALTSVSYPRLAGYKTVSFAGLDWFVKTAPVGVSPNGDFFSEDNAFVDSSGQLHLKVSKCSGAWCSAEVFTQQTVGYGAYSFTLGSPLNNLDPNLTLGLFTWDAQDSDQSNKEWDIEFSRWGDSGATSNAQYVVQPYDGPSNLFRFLIGPGMPSVHTVNWAPSQVSFSSASGFPIANWTYSANSPPVPTPGDVHLHLNLYVNRGSGPVSPTGTEIVIKSLQYTPSSSQIGFARKNDAVPFSASSSTIPVMGAAGCSATVESDSPWLSVAGSTVVATGGVVAYTVSDNLNTARTGNLILTSTNCPATLGRQVFSVAQAGFVCSPTFESSSTHIGFVQSIRSIFIRATAATCSWSVTSSAPWLQITSEASGAGDGSITFSADANTAAGSRTGLLVMNNGQFHSVYQDDSNSLFALSPLVAPGCSSQQAVFGVSWMAPTSIELRLNSPTGPLAGQFAATGTKTLPPLNDGTLIYMLQAGTTTVLASARTSVSSSCTTPSIGALGVVNAASFSPLVVAPGAYVSVFGTNLAASTAQATSIPYPNTLGGVTVTIAGLPCSLTYVSSGQINLVVPEGIPPGRYVLAIGSATSEIAVTDVSPGIFTLSGNGVGVPLAQVIAAQADSTTILSPYRCDNTCAAVPIPLPENLRNLYVVLYGTGIKHLKKVTATIGSYNADVDYVGAVPQYPGLDQVNLRLINPGPNIKGTQPIQLLVDGIASNTVQIEFQ